MTRRVAVALLLLAAGCARPAPQQPQAPPRAVVALAADPESGDVGRLTVSTSAGRVELTERHASTTVVSGAAPTAVTVMSDAEIERLFGDAIRGQAPAAIRFLLYFELGSDTLTAASKNEVPRVIDAVRGRVAPDVTVIGHTDTTGSTSSNAALGLQRASLIRDALLQAGLDANLMEIVSHGESDLLLPTADNVAEARNRRVEVIVR